MIHSILDIAQITWDGFTQVLEVAKESSDWNPFLKAALAGAVAVINLGKVCHYFLFVTNATGSLILLSKCKGTGRRWHPS